MLSSQHYDASGAKHYNYFRDYDPATGRYVESDPIGLRAGVNLYAYVIDDPLLYSDRFGLANSGPWPRPPATPGSGAGFAGGEASLAPLPGAPGVGGGISYFTCTDECGRRHIFRYYKICLAMTSGAGVSVGGVGGASGKSCRKDTYKGYFAEFGFGAGGLTGGFDVGLNDANVSGSGLPLPGGPSGVWEGGGGLGTPGGKASLCYYVPF